MSATYKLIIRPIAPLHLTTGPITGIDLISITRITYAPLPTTIIGLLANIYCQNKTCKTPHAATQDCIEAAIKDLIQIKEEMGIEEVWGPIITIDGKEYFQASNTLLPINKAREYIEYTKLDRICRERCYSEITEEWYEFREIGKTGIAIDRASRTVRQGFLYRQRYAWPHRIVKYEDQGPVEVGKWHYKYLVITRQDAPWLSEVTKTTWRIGGEGRQAIIEVEKVNKEPPEPSEEAILLTPLVFIGQPPTVSLGDLKELDRVYGVLTDNGPKVRVITTSLGYHETLRCRRPTYPALPPGTAIKLKQKTRHTGPHKELGYGTTLPP